MKSLYKSLIQEVNGLKFNKNFKLLKYSITGNIDNLKDFDILSMDRDFKQSNSLNESTDNKLIYTILKAIDNLNIRTILNSSLSQKIIYLKIADIIYNLLLNYLSKNNKPFLKVDVKRYDDNSLLVIINYKDTTISILFEK